VKSKQGLVIKVLSKPNCHLCEVAKDVVRRAREEIEFEIEEVDIRGDTDLFEKYKNDIPVIFINSRKAFKHRVEYKAFIKRLRMKV